MSNLCCMLRDMIKDEEKAPKEYEKLRAKMISLKRRTDKDNILVIQTISTLEDEVEVLKWVLKEPSDHVGVY